MSIFRKTTSVLAAAPITDCSLTTMEGIALVVAGRDFICWRSNIDVWPQAKSELLQSYEASTHTKEIHLNDLGVTLLFTEYIPKRSSLIAVRNVGFSETKIKLPTGDILMVDPELDVIAWKVDEGGNAIGSAYPLKRFVLKENYEPVK